jgi:hypothetical protein
MKELTAIVDEIFSSQPMAHWRQVFDKAHITYGLVRDPVDAIKDPQLRENGIVVPLEGAGGKLTSTISSPIQVHGVDLKNRVLYWTDRGDPPRGNTVNRASIDAKPQALEIVLTQLMEGIGIALDVQHDRMFVTDFAGSIYSAKLDGSGERNFLYAQGNLTGIAYAEI